MPSTALNKLTGNRLGEVDILIGRRPPGPEARRSLAERGEAAAVNRAGFVLLCAHLEGFLGDLVIDVVDYVNSMAPHIGNVPEALLACHVEPEISVIAEITDRVRRADRIARLFTGFGAVWASGTLSGSPLQADAVLKDAGNPKPKSVKKVMARVGIDDVFDRVSLPNVNVELRLNELVDGRNDVAHGLDRAIQDEDVDRQRRFVKDFATELDDLVASRLQTMCQAPQRPWP